MQEISKIIKIVVEKHLIPSVLSFVVGMLVFVLTPADNGLLQKMGKVGYVLFWACVTFLIVQFIRWSFQKATNWKQKRAEQDCLKKRETEKMESIMEETWSIVDRFTQEERAYLIRFLQTNNAPIDIQTRVFDTYNSLFSEHYTDKQTGIDKSQRFFERYKLREWFYNRLKYSYENYGRICHFEEDK